MSIVSKFEKDTTNKTSSKVKDKVKILKESTFSLSRKDSIRWWNLKGNINIDVP